MIWGKCDYLSLAMYRMPNITAYGFMHQQLKSTDKVMPNHSSITTQGHVLDLYHRPGTKTNFIMDLLLVLDQIRLMTVGFIIWPMGSKKKQR